ncbi:DMT family transporter [Metabacillus sediminilitoris]|uniref:Multidrug efflux SMR transporter n=1 Tax=Metabacillus sediminilitoris TaxID=2567941 RepID=A0A4S4C054_9BACI|nr:multidrug efflux SMR transporter [Metabacillus sediminilitoris]QGQ47919.1 QacE family quaternary ammonium compound efflux SMR transporter [Metabacillus sediminilitoris]THF80967.1 multidrug efflux SMR transporter [Metabacillus sediminilitoris]
MNKHWVIVYFAAIFEVSWVTGLKHAGSSFEWAGTILAIMISFYLLIKATNHLPISTVYAVFTGLGAAGTVLVEILFFSTSISLLKIGLCTLLISGVIGLKLVTNDRNTSKREV